MSERAFSEEEYAHLRRAIRVDLTDELSRWVKRRFWWMAGLSGLAGVVGISSIFVLATQSWLEQTLRDTRADLQEGVFAVQQATVDRLVDTLIDATSTTARLEERIDMILIRIDEADQSLANLQARTESTGLLARAVAQRGSVEDNVMGTADAEGSANLLEDMKEVSD